jgi:hypothetical protein
MARTAFALPTPTCRSGDHPESSILRRGSTCRAIIIISFFALLALVVSGTTLAGAATSHKFTATIQQAEISQTGGVPSAGSTATVVATFDSTLGGNGAEVTHVTFTGPTATPATFGFNAKESAFVALGSVTVTFEGTLAIQSDGSVKFAGTGKITGGADRYKGAKGSFTFTGTSPSAGPGHVDTFHYEGTITY